jgi:hypothetical protein
MLPPIPHGRNASRGHRGPSLDTRTGERLQQLEITVLDAQRLDLRPAIPRVYTVVMEPPGGEPPDFRRWPRLEWGWAPAPPDLPMSPEDAQRAVESARPARPKTAEGCLDRFRKLVKPEALPFRDVLGRARAGSKAHADELAVFGRKVVAFAEKYGPLGVCSHLLPRGHGGGCTELADERPDGRQPYEPLEVWWRLARQARALLEVIWVGQGGEVTDRAFWALAVLERERPPVRATGDDTLRPLALPSQPFEAAMTRWLRLAGFDLAVRLLDGRPAVTLICRGPSCFGTVAGQMAGAYTGARLGRCVSCGEVFSDLPRPGAPRQYCDEHGVEAELERKRRWYNKPGGGADQRREKRKRRA